MAMAWQFPFACLLALDAAKETLVGLEHERAQARGLGLARKPRGVRIGREAALLVERRREAIEGDGRQGREQPIVNVVQSPGV